MKKLFIYLSDCLLVVVDDDVVIHARRVDMGHGSSVSFLRCSRPRQKGAKLTILGRIKIRMYNAKYRRLSVKISGQFRPSA